jgi:hypothetical protein
MLLVIPTSGYHFTFDTTNILDALILLVLGVGYSLEPLWRMRTVTLIGMTVASWLDSYATAMIASVGAVVGMLLTQAGILFGCIWLYNQVFIYAYADYYDYSHILLGQLLLIAMIVGVMYFFFKFLQRAVFVLLMRVAFHG